MEDTPGEKLEDAVRENDRDAVLKLVNQGVDVNTPCPCTNRTALHIAAVDSKREFIQFLLSLGANVNARDRSGSTPLHYVGTPAAVRLLVEHGASVNAQGDSGATPLLDAILNNETRVIEALVDAGSDVSQADMAGTTPLAAALDWNCTRPWVATLLIERGADIGPSGNEQQTPLHCAIARQAYGPVEALIKRGASLTAKDSAGRTPLEMHVPSHFMARVAECIKFYKEPWDRRNPAGFGAKAQKKIITTVACAKRIGAHLPVELWQHIFSYTSRGDF